MAHWNGQQVEISMQEQEKMEEEQAIQKMLEKKRSKGKRERGWETLNGNEAGEDEDELIYVGPRRQSVTKYSIVNGKVWEKFSQFKMGDRTVSKHSELAEYDRREKKEEKKMEKYLRIIWNEKAIGVDEEVQK